MVAGDRPVLQELPINRVKTMSNLERFALNTVKSVMNGPAPQAPMIFLSGPRQVGKTHLARTLCDSYFNWDTR